MKRFCTENKIRTICSRAYHPQSQGKVERSHKEIRKKIHFDMMNFKNKGVNWVKNLPDYARILNEGAREELGWKSAFEIYYGRKSNRVISEHQGLATGNHDAFKVTPPRISDIEERQKKNCCNEGFG